MDVEKVVSEIGMIKEDKFCFKSYKTVKDRDGIGRDILDREEIFTLRSLNEQRQAYVNAIAAIDEKIVAINALPK